MAQVPEGCEMLLYPAHQRHSLQQTACVPGHHHPAAGAIGQVVSKRQSLVSVALLLLVAVAGSASAADGGPDVPAPVEALPPQEALPPDPSPAAAADPPSSTAPPGSDAAAPTGAISVAAGTAAQVAAAGVPDRCIIAGSALFSSCAREIAAAQNSFNLTVDVTAPQNYTQLLSERGYTRAQAVTALRQILVAPSQSCCDTACNFNQLLLCDCEPAVLQVAVRFAGADMAFYALLIEQLAAGCEQRLYFNQSCPADRTAALVASGVIARDGSAAVVEGKCVHTYEHGDGTEPDVAGVASSWTSGGYTAAYSSTGMYGDDGSSSSSSTGAYGSGSSVGDSGQSGETGGGGPVPGAPGDAGGGNSSTNKPAAGSVTGN